MCGIAEYDSDVQKTDGRKSKETRKIMQLKELCQKIDYEVLQGSLETDIADIIYDSRKISGGTMFVCMVGAVTDGHQYIPDAVAKGASAIVVERAEAAVQIPDDITVLKVDSARYALALMSAAYFGYPAEKLTTIGLTGTKGKTTTTYIINDVLRRAGKKAGLIGTIAVVIGGKSTPAKNTTPESYEIHRFMAQMVEAGCEYAVMEVSSQGFKLDRTAGIMFDYGVFTNLSPDHIGPGEHADFEEYLQCKRMLFQQCRTGIVNLDDEHTEAVLAGHTCDLITFSVREGQGAKARVCIGIGADEFADDAHQDGVLGGADGNGGQESDETVGGRSNNFADLADGTQRDGKDEVQAIAGIARTHGGVDGNSGVCASRPHDVVAFRRHADLAASDIEFLKENGKLGMAFTVTGLMECRAKIHIPGYFSVYNALTTMAVCHQLGVPQKEILAGLEAVQVKGRVEMIPVSKDFSVIIDYAHNEVSTRSVLETLKRYEPNRLIAVFGCGGNRSKVRRYDIGRAAGELADLCILTSDNPRFETVSDINNDIKVGLAEHNANYIEIEDRKEAIAYAITHAQPGDMIVMLGKGHEDYIEIAGKKYHFSEHEAIAEIMEDMKAGRLTMENRYLTIGD